MSVCFSLCLFFFFSSTLGGVDFYLPTTRHGTCRFWGFWACGDHGTYGPARVLGHVPLPWHFELPPPTRKRPL